MNKEKEIMNSVIKKLENLTSDGSLAFSCLLFMAIELYILKCDEESCDNLISHVKSYYNDIKSLYKREE